MGVEGTDPQVEDGRHRDLVLIENILELRAVAGSPGTGVERQDESGRWAKHATRSHERTSSEVRSTRCRAVTTTRSIVASRASRTL